MFPQKNLARKGLIVENDIKGKSIGHVALVAIS